jgi:segregation and condensation protein A
MDATLFVDRPEASAELTRHDIRLEKFSGPLDLLLYLIRKDELDIKDIPIAHITRQYLDYLEILRALDLEVAGEYILMAATLIRIKAQMLLPRPPEEPEEEDPRGALVAALLEYQQFREASGVLHALESDMRRRFPNPGNMPERRVEETLLGPSSIYDLVTVMGELLRKSRPDISHQVFAEPYHVEVQIEVIKARLLTEEALLLSQLVGRQPVRGLLVATFLALLELTRLHVIAIEQAVRFRDILIRRAQETGPHPPEVQHDTNSID